MTRVPLVRGVTLVPFLLAACGGERPAPSGGAGRPAGGAALTGAGATFPNPIYAKWFDLYAKQTGVRINYQSIGSGGGIQQITNKTVDFGASDAPLTDAQLAKTPAPLQHIPTVLGAVVVTYNLPGVPKGLKLRSEDVADIFLGKISKWNDKRIADDNPGISLPDKPIVVVRRSDGSGTTSIFTDYLTKASADWASKVGKGTSVNWPVGLGGKGNEGVAGLVKQSEGSIGYVELAYAVKNNLPYAALQNKAGKFVEPTLDAVSAAAAAAAANMPRDLRASITNADGSGSYPISGFTWLLVYREMKDKTKAAALQRFLKWAMGEGQGYAKGLYYAPLPGNVIKVCNGAIASVVIR